MICVKNALESLTRLHLRSLGTAGGRLLGDQKQFPLPVALQDWQRSSGFYSRQPVQNRQRSGFEMLSFTKLFLCLCRFRLGLMLVPSAWEIAFLWVQYLFGWMRDCHWNGLSIQRIVWCFRWNHPFSPPAICFWLESWGICRAAALGRGQCLLHHPHTLGESPARLCTQPHPLSCCWQLASASYACLLLQHRLKSIQAPFHGHLFLWI